MAYAYRGSVLDDHLRSTTKRLPPRPPRPKSPPPAREARLAEPIPAEQFYPLPAALLQSAALESKPSLCGASSHAVEITRRWLQRLQALKKNDAPLPPLLPTGVVKRPASVWEVFWKQQAAFDFLRTRMEPLAIFSFEDAGPQGQAQRKFLVTSYDHFWAEYRGKARRRLSDMSDDVRHYYELIPQGHPCRLYFDLEFQRALNPDIDDAALMTRFLTALRERLHSRYGIACSDDDLVRLESSTDQKFSQHVIVHTPRAVFADNIQAGRFVAAWLSDLTLAAADPSSPDHAVSQGLQVVTTASGARGFVIDPAVYTKNRTFRIVGSSKFGRTALLLPPAAAAAKPWHRQPLGWFRRTLVCAVGEVSTDLRILRETAAATSSTTAAAPGPWRPPPRHPDELYERSPYPAVDAFIARLVSTSPHQGFIRSVVYFAEGKQIMYPIGGNRYCELAGRAHKSNHVHYVVDLKFGLYYQRCMDADCQRVAPHGPAHPLPDDLNPFATPGGDLCDGASDADIAAVEAAEAVEAASSSAATSNVLVHGSAGNHGVPDPTDVVDDDTAYWDAVVATL